MFIKSLFGSSGTKSITANGTYDVTNYASASVNVPNPSTGTLTVTTVGTLGVTNYASANVQLHGGGWPIFFQKIGNNSFTYTLESNKDYFIFIDVYVNTKMCTIFSKISNLTITEQEQILGSDKLATISITNNIFTCATTKTNVVIYFASVFECTADAGL